MLYYGCDRCSGLLTDAADLHLHKLVCTGRSDTSSCLWFVCDRKRYLLLLKALHVESCQPHNAQRVSSQKRIRDCLNDQESKLSSLNHVQVKEEQQKTVDKMISNVDSGLNEVGRDVSRLPKGIKRIHESDIVQKSMIICRKSRSHDVTVADNHRVSDNNTNVPDSPKQNATANKNSSNIVEIVTSIKSPSAEDTATHESDKANISDIVLDKSEKLSVLKSKASSGIEKQDSAASMVDSNNDTIQLGPEKVLTQIENIDELEEFGLAHLVVMEDSSKPSSDADSNINVEFTHAEISVVESGEQSNCNDSEHMEIHIELKSGESLVVDPQTDDIVLEIPDANEIQSTMEEISNAEKKVYTDNMQDNGLRTRVYRCSKCPFTSQHVGFYDRHLRHCGTKKSYVCEKCGFLAHDRHSATRHRNKHKLAHMCEFCSKRFGEKRDLKLHRFSHTGEYPLSCTECDFRCRQITALKFHMKKHTNEYVRCMVAGCNFKSHSASALKCHHDAKHEVQYKHSCAVCNYTTNNQSSFAKHTKVHLGLKNFKCPECDHRAITHHDVVRHMRSHTNEKVYFCDLCPFSTAYCTAMKVHLMAHYDCKPWRCDVCTYRGISKSDVLRHVRQVHREIDADLVAHVVRTGVEFNVDMSKYYHPSSRKKQSLVIEQL